MPIPVVPVQDPDQSELDLPNISNPYLGIWWTAQTVSGVPENVMGWLVAQGWEITGVTPDATTNPPTSTYALAKQGMQPLQVLLSLCNSYKIAADEARTANEVRYNQVVANWTDMIASSQTQFEAQTTEQNTSAGVYLTDLDTYMTAVEALIEDNRNQIVLDTQTATTALDAMNDKLADLETNANNNATTISGLLTDQAGYLNTFLTDFAAKLAELDTNYSAHVTEIANIIADTEVDLGAFVSEQSIQTGALADAYSALVGELDGLLVTASSDLTTVASDINGVLSNLTADFASLDTDIDSQRGLSSSALAAFVSDFSAVLSLLTGDHGSMDADVSGVIAVSANALASMVSDFATTLALYETDYEAIAAELDAIRALSAIALTAHKGEYGSEISKLETDYVSHEVAANGFLIDLGTTELARINELFAATLSTQIQDLIDKGLYSSVVATDITARNARDRDEQVQMLNDRLAREKLANTHQIYQQEQSMRDRTMAGKDRLHGVEQDVRARHYEQVGGRFALQQAAHDKTLAATDRKFTAQQDKLQWEASQLTAIFQQLLGVRDRVLSGSDRLNAVKQSVFGFQAAQITNVYQLLQSVRDRTLSAETSLYQLRDANTRLNLATQSQLYEAGQSMRRTLLDEVARLQQLSQALNQWQAGQRDTLLEQVQRIEAQHLEGIDRQHSAQQDVSRVAMSERDALLAQLQSAVQGIIAGRERYSAMLMQNASTLADHKHRAIAERMNTAVTRLEGWKSVAAENQRLMAYQLDTRNNLLVGLYSFVERREDIGPEWKDMAAMIAGLGDSAGGWISP